MARRGGLGDAIATLDGFHLGAITPTRSETISPVPAQVPTAIDADATFLEREFLAYMNQAQGPTVSMRHSPLDPGEGALYSGGSNWTPGLPMTPSSAGLAAALQTPTRKTPPMRYPQGGEDYAGDNYVGGSTYYPGARLYSNAGLAGDMARLENLAVVSRHVQQRGVREQVIGTHWGDNYVGGSTYFPGAPLYSSAGLAGLGASPRAAPATRAIANKDVRAIFETADAYNDFVRIGGDNVLERVKQQQAQAARRKSQDLVMVTAQLAAVRLFRARMLTALGGVLPPWKRVEVVSQWMAARRDTKTAHQLQGLAGLHGLNLGLEGLEGRLGRRIKKGMKKVGKLTGKMVKSGLKMGLRMSTGGIIPI